MAPQEARAVIVDTNILVYARNTADPRHAPITAWLSDALSGPARIGLSWHALVGFVRISTNPRIYPSPLAPEQAWTQVEEWLDADAAWLATETNGHATILGDLIRRYALSGPIVSDAHLAALAIEHGVALASTDGDFARFTELRWINPLA